MNATLNNHTQLLIGKNIARTGGATGLAASIAVPSLLAVGEIVITDVDGTILDETTVAAKQRVVVVQGQGPNLPLIKSAPILKTGVQTYIAKAFSYGVEEVEFIGYNPVTALGAIEVINSNPYILRSALLSNFVEFADKQMFVNADYVSDASATESEVAKGLVSSLISNTQRFPNIPYTAHRVNDATTVTAFTGTSVMTLFTKGSKTVSFYTAAGVASTGTVAVGDVINVPTSGGQTFTYSTAVDAFDIFLGTTLYSVADAGSADQNGVAQAAAINAGTQATASYDSGTDVMTITYNNGIQLPPPLVYNTVGTVFVAVTIASGDAVPTKYIAATAATAAASFTLDVAYQGETGYVADGTVLATNSGVATVITAWGIKLLGKPKSFLTNVLRYDKNKWNSTIQNAGITPIVVQTGATEGTGRYEQIADEEYFYQLAEGMHDSVTFQWPNVVMRTNVEATGRYSIVDIRWAETPGTAIVANSTSFKQLRLACNKNGGFISGSQFNADSGADTTVLKVLDAWLSTLAAQISKI